LEGQHHGRAGNRPFGTSFRLFCTTDSVTAARKICLPQKIKTKQNLKQMKSLFAFLLVLAASHAAAPIVTLTAYYPGPSFFPDLYVRGDACGLNWDKGVAMTRLKGTDQFTINLDCDATTKFEVKLLVKDSTWMLGANHHVDLSQESTLTVYPWFNTKAGSTATIIKNVYSKELNNTRDVIFYTPPSYNENTYKRYKNVLIMHDGQNLFNPATAPYGSWNAQQALDSSIIGGASDEVLIVGPYNTPDRNDEYTYIYDPSEGCGGKGDLYLDWLESTLLPLVKDQFRVDISRETLGILGSSLGGLISCYGGWTRPEVYGKVGCMSSSFWWDSNDYQKHVVTASTPAAPPPQFYMDSGTGSTGEKECTLYTSQVKEEMEERGFVDGQTVETYVDEGATHSESSWGPRLHFPIEFLYPPSAV